MSPLFALLVLQAAQGLPDRIANPSFERELRGWQPDFNVGGYRAHAQREVAWSSQRAPEGRAWLEIGWAARRGTPPGSYFRLTTRVSARRYRGRTLAFSAAVRLPAHAHRQAALVARIIGADASRDSEQRLDAGMGWRRERLVIRVPRDARAIELGFLVDGRGGELEADAARLEILR